MSYNQDKILHKKQKCGLVQENAKMREVKKGQTGVGPPH